MKPTSSSLLRRFTIATLLTIAALLYLAASPSFMSASEDGMKPLLIQTNNESHAPELSGQKLTVSGNGNDIKVLGECSTLVVTGSGNKIGVVAVDKIVVTGANNTITWASAIKNDVPGVDDKGSENKISSGTVSAD